MGFAKDELPQPNAAAVAEQRTSLMGELRSKLDDLDAEIFTLAEKEALDEAEEERWADLVAERDSVEPEYTKLLERAERVDQIKKRTYRTIHGMPEVKKPVEELYFADVRRMDWRTARDGALRILDDKEQNFPLSPAAGDYIEQTVRSNTDLARRIIVTENEHYRSAWFKLMKDTNAAAFLSDDERMALQRYDEYRAQAEGATTQGGFAIPVFIDPSVILTNQESDNPFLQIARVEDINTNAWKGVSAAGVTWSFDTEAAEVSDDSITLSQPSVTVFMARGFIPYSIEVGDDWPGFQAEMGRLLAIGYDELLIDKFSRGSGTGEPKGIITALDANTNVEVAGSTVGAFGQEDIYAVWAALPQKYRRRASWMMGIDYMNRIRQFGAANVYHAATVTLTQGSVENLFNRPVYENAYFPAFSSTTSGQANRVVVGDFSNYVIARRMGMTVELVPHLFATANNLPSGQRGWFAHARIGGNSVNDNAFRLLHNT